jgi:hypothetical protein
MLHMHCWVSALFVQWRTFLGYSISARMFPIAKMNCVLLSSNCDTLISVITLSIQGVPKLAYKLLTTVSRMLNVHEKNMEKMFPIKKSIIFIIIINGNTM